MATRINPDLDNTQELTTQIIQLCLKQERVMFLVPAGQGNNYIARVRTKLSRKRKEMLAKKKRFIRFKLRASIHAHTEGGKRYDSLIFWAERNSMHTMAETLEDILSNE